MESVRSPPRKRVKNRTWEQSNSFYNFEVFLNDDIEPSKERPAQKCRSFGELFEKDWKFKKGAKKFEGLESALLMTFAASRELLRPLLEKGIKTVVAYDCGASISKTMAREEEGFSNFLTVFPQKEFKDLSIRGSFHPKLFVLKFNDRLRIIIGSGNLLVQDWLYWDNAFWAKDYFFPFSRSTSEGSLDGISSGGNELRFSHELYRYICLSMGDKWERVIDFLQYSQDTFTFKENEVCLITSIPGQWTQSPEALTSLYQVREALKTFKPCNPFTLDNTSFFYVASSIGCINIKLMSDFAEVVYSDEKSCFKGSLADKQQLAKNFSVLYPSKGFVEKSLYGDRTASCLFLKRNDFKSFKFQKGVLKSFEKNSDSQQNAKVESAHRIPHLKCCLITNNEDQITDDSVIYIGSHNFTQAAWGMLDKDKPQAVVFNYELGVLIPPRLGSKTAKEGIIKTFGFRFPALPFTEDKEPFFSG